jgi:hypothetical protein
LNVHRLIGWVFQKLKCFIGNFLFKLLGVLSDHIDQRDLEFKKELRRHQLDVRLEQEERDLEAQLAKECAQINGSMSSLDAKIEAEVARVVQHFEKQLTAKAETLSMTEVAVAK